MTQPTQATHLLPPPCGGLLRNPEFPVPNIHVPPWAILNSLPDKVLHPQEEMNNLYELYTHSLSLTRCPVMEAHIRHRDHPSSEQGQGC